MKIKAIGFTLLTLCVLTGCGQKRPLYLSQEPISNNTTPGSESSTESTEQGKN